MLAFRARRLHASAKRKLRTRDPFDSTMRNGFRFFSPILTLGKGMTMRRPVVCILLTAALVSASSAAAADRRSMTLDDLFRFQRIADPQISPDGKSVVYVVTTVDLAGNKTSSNLWLASVDGDRRRQLTTTPKKNRHPRWRPDGKQILFESDRSG